MRIRPRRFLITGGPRSLKTTIMEIIARLYKGRVLIAPEAATILLGGGLDLFRSPQEPIVIGAREGIVRWLQPRLDALRTELTERDERPVYVPGAYDVLEGGQFPPPGENPDPIILGHFQWIVYRLILALEDMYEQLAMEQGITVLVCDRGCWDGEAYMDGDRERFMRLVGVEYRDMTRYHRAACLQSLASYDPDAYNARPTEGNEIRMESSHVTAARIDALTWQAWEDHHNIERLLCSLGVDGKIGAVRQILDEMLAE